MLNCVDGFLVLPINKQHFSLDGDSPDMDSGNQISFSSLISFHMISFHMILTWSIRYHSVRWYHFMRSPLRGRISHLTQSLSGHFIRICHWKVSPCLAHQHPPYPGVTSIIVFPHQCHHRHHPAQGSHGFGRQADQKQREWLYQRRPGHHHRHHILLRTTIWSNCHTKRQLSPSWSHLWTWSSWKGPRQLCQQLLVAMWHTKKNQDEAPKVFIWYLLY